VSPAAKRVGLAAVAAAGAALGLFLSRLRPSPPNADPGRVSAGIAFFQARWDRDDRDYLAGRQLVNRLIIRFGLEADLADVEHAEQIAARLIGVAPEPAAGWSRLSNVFLMQHKFADARDAADSALALAPGDPDAVGAAADAALAMGQYSRAEEFLRRLPAGNTGTLVRWAARLDLGGRSGDAAVLLDRACRALDRGAAPAATRAWCLTQLAAAEHGARGPDAAAARLRQALGIEPGYRGALEGLADLALAREQWERARDLYGRIATEAHPDLYLRLAEVLAELGDHSGAAQAEAAFERAALGPSREALYGPHIVAYLLSRGPAGADLALAVARREVSRRPTVESWDLLAWTLLYAGEPSEALQAADSATTWGEPSPTMQYHRARILEALGRGEEARAFRAAARRGWTLLEPEARRELRGPLGDRRLVRIG
jgi:tetratricopeptide (TPR) repeat protein